MKFYECKIELKRLKALYILAQGDALCEIRPHTNTP